MEVRLTGWVTLKGNSTNFTQFFQVLRSSTVYVEKKKKFFLAPEKAAYNLINHWRELIRLHPASCGVAEGYAAVLPKTH